MLVSYGTWVGGVNLSEGVGFGFGFAWREVDAHVPWVGILSSARRRRGSCGRCR